MAKKKISVVYNACYGGFGLSKEAAMRLAELGVESAKEALLSKSDYWFYTGDDLQRHDPRLVKVVKELGRAANGPHSILKIAKLTGNKYIVDRYDGWESITEPEDIDWIAAEQDNESANG